MDDSQELSGRRRKRVSRACDRCRSKKDRCDGARPTCQPCKNSGHFCSYDPTAKKRGLPEGYVRGLEKLWALSISNIDGLEARVLALLGLDDEDSSRRQKLLSLWADENVSDNLHEAWKSSELFAEMEKLMSSAEAENAASSASSTDLDNNYDLSLGQDLFFPTRDRLSLRTGPECPDLPRSDPLSLRPKKKRRTSPEYMEDPNTAHLSLPAETPQLIEAYFSYTHIWFPVIAKHTVLRTSYTYTSQPKGVGRMTVGSGDHAALWAILSYMTVQTRPCTEPSQQQLGSQQLGSLDPNCKAKEFYTNARNLIPPLEENRFELGHVQSLLLLTLVNIGLGDWNTAWLLSGQATRWATNLHGGANSSPAEGGTRPTNSSDSVVLGCFVVDTILSVRLKAWPRMRPEDLRVPLLEEDGLEEWGTWSDVLSSTSQGHDLRRSSNARGPLLARSCFNRLVELAAFLSKMAHQDPFDAGAADFCQSMLNDIQAWCEKIPSACRLGDGDVQAAEKALPFLLPHQSYLSLTYLATISFFHKRFAAELQSSPSTLEKTLQIGTVILAAHAKNFGQAILPPIFEYSLRTIIEGVQTFGTQPEDAQRRLSFGLKCISSTTAKTAEVWPVMRNLRQETTKENVPPPHLSRPYPSQPPPPNSDPTEAAAAWCDTPGALDALQVPFADSDNPLETYENDPLNIIGLDFEFNPDPNTISNTNNLSTCSQQQLPHQEPGAIIIPSFDDFLATNSPHFSLLDPPKSPTHAGGSGSGTRDNDSSPAHPNPTHPPTPESMPSNSTTARQKQNSSPHATTKRPAPVNELDSIFDDLSDSDSGDPDLSPGRPSKPKDGGGGVPDSMAEGTCKPSETGGDAKGRRVSRSESGSGSRKCLFPPPSIGDLWPPPGFFPDEDGEEMGK